MSEPVRQYLRWVLGVQGTPEADLAGLNLRTVINARLATIAVALDRYFPDEPTPAEAAALVSKIRQSWVQPEGLNPVLAERVILHAYGEDGLLDNVPDTEVGRIENVIAYGIRRELKIQDTDIDEFIDEIVDYMKETEEA